MLNLSFASTDASTDKRDKKSEINWYTYRDKTDMITLFFEIGIYILRHNR